jgi:hypothetical protein
MISKRRINPRNQFPQRVHHSLDPWLRENIVILDTVEEG